MTVVAVTGGAGFLGQALVHSLIQLDSVELVLALDTEMALDRGMFEDSPKCMYHRVGSKRRCHALCSTIWILLLKTTRTG